MVSTIEVAMGTSPCVRYAPTAVEQRHRRTSQGMRHEYVQDSEAFIDRRISWMARYRDRLTKNLSEQLNRVAKLVVSDVRRRSKPQHVSTCVAVRSTLAQSTRDVGCLARADRQKATATFVRHRFDEGDR